MSWFRRKGDRDRGKESAAPSAADEIDAETLRLARELKREREAERSFRRKKGSPSSGEGDFPTADELGLVNAGKAWRGAFARGVGDTVLSNRFVDAKGEGVRGVTVKQASAMDGLRDTEETTPPLPGGLGVGGIPPIPPGGVKGISERENVGTFRTASSPMNPEGLVNLPRMRAGIGTSDIARRYNEAMNPAENGYYGGLPERLVAHFAQYTTFIGYPMCSFLSGHPTISNAINTPGEDAVAPGYELQFLDSDDIDANGISDDMEMNDPASAEIIKDLRRVAALKTLESTLAALKPEYPTVGNLDAPTVIALNNLDLELQKLALLGGCDTERVYREARAFSDKYHSLAVLGEAVRSMERFAGGGRTAVDKTRETLNDLARALERVAVYREYSDRNREVIAPLEDALTTFAARQDDHARDVALQALGRAVAAMDTDEFDFTDEEEGVDGVAAPKGVPPEDKPEDKPEGGEGRPEGAESQQDDIGEGVATPGGGAGGLAAAMSPLLPGMGQEETDRKSKEEAERQAKDAAERKRRAALSVKMRQKALDAWKNRADEMGLSAICRGVIRDSRTFGIGIVIPVVDGLDYEKPYDINLIKPGTYRGMALVEPTWIYPEMDKDDLVNPLSRSFFEPTYWAVNTSYRVAGMNIRRIHRSWMVIVRNKEVPDMLKPMYYYGGIPLTQEIAEAVFIADKLMNEAPKLAMTKRTLVVKGSDNDFISNPEGVVERLEARAQVQDNFSTLYVGRQNEVTQLETSLADFDQLIVKANQRIASIAKMPETKLFKTQLAGMNSAGRYEWDDYAQFLMSIQSNFFTPILKMHYRFDSKSQSGKPIEVKIRWNKIDVPSEQEQQQIESGTVQMYASAIQAGMITADEGRTLLRSDKDSSFSTIPAENLELEEQWAQQRAQQEGDGGAGGAGEMPQMPEIPGMGGGDGDAAPKGQGQNNPKPPSPTGNGVAKGSPLKEPTAPKSVKPPKAKK